MLKSNMIGTKIVQARKKATISQARLAEQLFISPQAVGKWERGESMPDIITLNRLAEILGVDLNYFSESFQSHTNDVESNQTFSNHSTEFQSERKNIPTLPNETSVKKSWDMSNENLLDNDFSGLKNLHEKLSSSNIQRCLFIGSEMSGILLKNNNIDNCNFSDSDISKSQFHNSHLAHNDFSNCVLRESKFSGSYIEKCDFTGVDFTDAIFISGGFQNNKIVNTAWNNISFNAMYMADLIFEGTLENCFFENCSFTGVKFQNATLINTFFKNNKRLKKIQFIDCKADKMTYAFLKNGKADLSGISLLTED